MYCKSLLLLLFIISGGLSTSGQSRDFDSPNHLNRSSPIGPKLQTGWYFIVDTSEYKRKQYKKDDYQFIDPAPIATAGDFKLLKIYKNRQGSFEMLIKLGEGAAISWRNATRLWAGKKLAFILNDTLIEADYVNGEIASGTSALIGNVYSYEELNKIKRTIQKEKSGL